MTKSSQKDAHKTSRDDRPRCPTCGCRHLPVLYTRQRAQQIVRVRACRNCGRRIVTRETICN
jgi:transcriptional regulator NrdR family protein